MDLSVACQSSALQGALRPPGDKSISHRALLLGALAHGPTRLRGFLRAGVTQAMMDCLRDLGADAEFFGPNDLLIMGGQWRDPAAVLDCRNSGATMRMLLGALACQPVQAVLDGTPRLRQRPMGRVVEPLRRMGARIAAANGKAQPPLRVRGGPLHGIELSLQPASAQVKTAILLAGLYAHGPTVLHEGQPTRDHTERLLHHLGVSLAIVNGRITLTPDGAPLAGFTLPIPGDFSSAAFPLAAALLIPRSRLVLEGVGVNPTRTGLLEVLEAMGARIALHDLRQAGGEPVADLEVQASGLRGTRVEGSQVVRMIDEFPILAVIATQAEGETVVRGAAELRHKESDRIADLVAELRKMGAQIEELPDGFVVQGPTALRGAVVDSKGDHRLAMALAVAGMVARGSTVVHGAQCVDESYPGFAAAMRSVGAELG